MILASFETLLDQVPPAWLRKRESAELMRVFAAAFDVTPPAMGSLSADEALAAFREFTAACMESVLVGEGGSRRSPTPEAFEAAGPYRARLSEEAVALGDMVRKAIPVRPSQAFRLVRFFYRGIGIELTGEVPGEVRFGPCSFALRYTPFDCWFMSAFDEGFIRGVTGIDGTLAFSCRLTEGAPSCRARFE